MLGVPFLFALSWGLDSSGEWRVTGVAQQSGLFLFCLLLVCSIVAGVYHTFFKTTVTIDCAARSVVRIIRIWRTTVRRSVWRFSEFQRVEVRHRAHGDGPSDFFQTTVGIRHSTGFVVWVRAFWSPVTAPSAEVTEFAGDLRKIMGLTDVIPKT
jgi:hypothetical protein